MTGLYRVQASFNEARRARRTALLPYFVAGYPNFRTCRELLWDAADAGADVVELGIPFSDPVADGPTIQAAMHEALRRGATPSKTLRFVEGLRREGYVVPIVGMTYANVLYGRGFASAARAWTGAGLDGAVVPDVPVEESKPLASALRSNGLASVFLASPATSAPRVRRILAASTGFVYLVAVYGTTGARRGIAPETRPLIRRVRQARRGSRPAVCVGFGVSRPADVTGLRRAGAEGVIVGSALVDRVRREQAVGPFLRTLARAARSG